MILWFPSHQNWCKVYQCWLYLFCVNISVFILPFVWLFISIELICNLTTSGWSLWAMYKLFKILVVAPWKTLKHVSTSWPIFERICFYLGGYHQWRKFSLAQTWLLPHMFFWLVLYVSSFVQGVLHVVC